jgi:periplasmic protein TonB
MHATPLLAAAASLAVHLAVGFALGRVEPRRPPPPAPPVRMEVRSVPTQPADAVEAPRPREAPKPVGRRAARTRARQAAQAPHAAPHEAPEPAPKPVFGMNLAATTYGEAAVAVAEGHTMMAAPSALRPERIEPLAPGESDAARSGAALRIQRLPEIDERACGRMITYPTEAEALGIEGDVKLRVPLDDRGRAHDVRVLQGLGHGLDEVARDALTALCRFSPAVATDGRAVAYVIPSYTFHFEIPR